VIVRDNRSPRGRDEGPVRLYDYMQALPLDTPLARIDVTWEQTNKALFAKEPKPPREKAPPVLLHVKCNGCPTVFETYEPRRAYCTTVCRTRRQNSKRPSRSTRNQGPSLEHAQCHPDRRHIAHGKCWNCYMRDWRAARRLAARIKKEAIEEAMRTVAA
jgi:hypothetical protein